MANQIEAVNTIAITSIEAINTITDANLQALNTLEFTGVAPDAHTLIATATASSSATLDFTSGIDSTYDVYEWHFENMHPQTNGKNFGFQVNAVGESGFNETITSTHFRTYHTEAGGGGSLEYYAANEQAQGTAYNLLQEWVGSTDGTVDDNGVSGILTLYAPSSTTYVKHFTATTSSMYDATALYNGYTGGYINTTAAIDEISFNMNVGNIDAGSIYMYGVG